MLSGASTTRPNGGEIPPQLKKMIECQPAEAMWFNGSVVCDKHLKFNKCSREGCIREHRALLPNEKPPLCREHFMRRDPCHRGAQCPLAHTLTGARNPEEFGRITAPSSPVYYEDDAVRPKRSEGENTRRSEPVRDSEETTPKKNKPDLQRYQPPPRRDSRQEPTNVPRFWGPAGRTTNGAPFGEGPAVSYSGSQPRRNWDGASPIADQASIFRGLPSAVQAGLSPEVPTPLRESAEPPRSAFGPGFIPKFMSSGPQASDMMQPRNHPSHHAGPSHEPHLPSGSSGGVPLHPDLHHEIGKGGDAGNTLMQIIKKLKEEVNEENLSGKDTNQEAAFYHQIRFVESVDAELKSLTNSTSERLPSQDAQTKLHEQQSVIPEVAVDHEPTNVTNDSSKAISQRITPPEARPKLDEHPDVVPTVVERVTADEVSRATSGEISTADPCEQPTAVPEIAIAKAKAVAQPTVQRSDDRPRTTPEWELLRCFNCFRQGHPDHRCYQRKLDIHEREKLRDEQGVINRRWTTELLGQRQKFAPAIITKHLGFSRIWEPYTTAFGLIVTPHAIAPSQRASQICNKGVQTDNLRCNQGVQTDNLGCDQGVQVARSSPRNKRRKKAEESKPESAPITPEKQMEKCWLCKGYHPDSECNATSPYSDPADREDNRWMDNIKDLPNLPKKHALGRQIGSKEMKSRKGLKNPALAKSGLVCSNTTTYKVEKLGKDSFQAADSDDVSYEETALDRDDLTLLGKLDKELKLKRRSSSGGQSSPIGGATIQPSHLCRCPNELLESIFAYAADGDSFAEDKKIKDIITGNKWDIEEGVEDTFRRARNLAGVAKSCRQLRLVAQRVIYRVICIKSYKPLGDLARTLTADPELGLMVQVLKIHLEQTTVNYKNRGVYRHEMVNNVHVTNTDYASVFVRIVESCRNLQILSTKLYGSVLGFGALQGRFQHMREIVIADEISRGQVLNKMWNHLIDFPKLNKFKIIHSPMNDAVDFTPLEIPFFMAERGLDCGFRTLSNLQLENAPEVSDGLLVFLVRRFYVLTKLAIVNCKLVTSAGIARALAEIPNRLCHLIFWVWLDRSGHASPREALPSEHHLCAALREHGTSLMTMNLKPHKVCEDLWKESHFDHLQRIMIDMAQFSHCRKEVIARGDSYKHESLFEDAYKVACSEDRLPCMDEGRLSIRLHTNGISYH